MNDTRCLLSHFATHDELAWLVDHPDAVLEALQPPWIYVFPMTVIRTVQRVPALRTPVLAACDSALCSLAKELDQLPPDTGMRSHFLGNQWCAYHHIKETLTEMLACVHPGCSHLAEPPRADWTHAPPIEVLFPVCEEHLLPGTYEVID
jgi:hypothetical protein